MPVKITTHGGRQQGRVRHDIFPVSKLGVTGLLQSQLGTETERQQRVKTLVLRELGVTVHNKVILEISGETYEYDEGGEWDVNRMATTPNAGGTPVTTVRFHMPMRRAMAPLQVHQPLGHRGQASFVPFPDDVSDVAWEEHSDRLCCPRQLAVLTQVSLATLCADMDGFLDGAAWQNIGLTSEQLMAWLKDKGLPFHCYCDDTHHTWTPVEPQGPAIAWFVHDGHEFFYRHGRCLEKYRPKTSDGIPSKLKADHSGEALDVADWQPWEGEPSPGYFYCCDLKEA